MSGLIILLLDFLGCEEHITILPHCNVYYKMTKTKLSHEISFIVRSDHTIYIELRNSPNSQYPYFKVPTRYSVISGNHFAMNEFEIDHASRLKFSGDGMILRSHL